MMHAVAIALSFAVLLATVVVAVMASSRFQLAAQTSSQYDPVGCVPDEETKEKIRAIMMDAAETALKNHIVRMHEIWMKDETGQPARARNGSRQGLKAYIAGRSFILKWNPPLC